MSLLQRLAERALGVAEPPLRSQRAVLAPHAVQAAAEPVLPAALAGAMAQAEPVPKLQARHVREDAEPAPAAQRPVPNVAPLVAPTSSPTTEKDTPPAPLLTRPVATELPAVVRTQPRAMAEGADVVMPRPHRGAVPAEVPARIAPPVVVQPAEVPAPLLPPQAPQALPAHSATPLSPASNPAPHDTRRRGPAHDSVTEVHVSIGRVELTALAPAPSAARSAPRSREPSRSLADYLRPQGHGKGQGGS